MNLSNRERKAVVVGGIIAGFILVIAYVVAPLARIWFQGGTELGPKLAYVDKLRERVHGQESLFDRREVLVRRLGSLLGQEAPVARAQSVVPIARATQATAATPTAGIGGPAEVADREKPGVHAQSVVPIARATQAAAATPTARIAGPAAAGERENPGESDMEAASTEEAAGAVAPAERAAAAAGRPSSGVSLAAHLERAAKKSGVKIKRISPKKQSRSRRGSRHFNSVALQIRIESDMQNLMKLLHGLEKGDRFVRVEQMQLRRDLKKGDNMEISLDIVGYEAAAR